MQIALRTEAFWEWLKAESISRDEAARRIGVNRATAYRVGEGIVVPSPKFIAGLVIAAKKDRTSGETFDRFFEIVEAA